MGVTRRVRTLEIEVEGEHGIFVVRSSAEGLIVEGKEVLELPTLTKQDAKELVAALCEVAGITVQAKKKLALPVEFLYKATWKTGTLVGVTPTHYQIVEDDQFKTFDKKRVEGLFIGGPKKEGE